MSILIKHRTVSGVYLCNEGIHWYWGPREQAKVYSAQMAATLIKAFPNWNYFLGINQEDALVEIDPTPVTVPPPRRQCSSNL